MYAVVFAGGVGQRLWPLSRKNTPKQFAPLLGDKSSYQLTVERLLKIMPPGNICVSTNALYADVLRAQTPDIPPANFILEPARRDVAAAVALAFFTMQRIGLRGTVLFQWADLYVQNDDALIGAFRAADELLQAEPNRIVIIGETPRFPNENIGWVELGEPRGDVQGIPGYGLRSFTYRPPLEDCVSMFESGNYIWNSGFFATTVDFMVESLRGRTPEIATIVEQIVASRGTPDESEQLLRLYPTIPAIHFDHALLERLDTRQYVVLKADLKWADPGSLYALKELLQQSPGANALIGQVVAADTRDSLIYNDEPGKVVAVMGMDGVVVVNTPDALLVISRHAVRYIATLLKQLDAAGYGELL